MLNFDKTHQSIDGNINDKKCKKAFKSIIISGLVIGNLLTFSGCAEVVTCNVNGKHAHYYVNDDNLGRYIVSEYSYESSLNRTDDYILIDEDAVKLFEFINENGLFKISENQQAISDIVAHHRDYTEYRYSYDLIYPGKIPMLITCYSWTTDTSKRLTGETRECHYVYYGYRITKNKKGDYELIQSDPVDDLSELPPEYLFIKENFYVVVNSYDKSEIFDYEDGQEDKSEIINEEDYLQPGGNSR